MKVGALHVDQQLLYLSSQSIRRILQHCTSTTADDGHHLQQLVIYLRSPPSTVTRLTSSLFEGISRVYNQAFRLNADLDVRILLSNLKTSNESIKRSQSIQPSVIFTDGHFSSSAPWSVSDSSPRIDIGPLSLAGEEAAVDGRVRSGEEEWKTYDNVVIGGTFDHLHSGHKLLLSNAILRCRRKLTIGLTVQEMLKKKRLADLIQPIKERQEALQDFCQQVDPSLEYNIVHITDPFGPSTVDPQLQAIVASEETLDGAKAVNVERAKKNLSRLDVHTFPLNDVEGSTADLRTISSSWYRQNMLGRLIRSPAARPNLPRRPYLIGLTGGSGSGKSRIGTYLAARPGVLVIDCDKIAHEAYRKGTTLHGRLVEEYGEDILDTATGEIARQQLGKIIFANPASRQRLNEMIWPEVMKYCLSKIAAAQPEVAVIDAALLLEAGWSHALHEIWVTFVLEEEAVARVMARDGISQEYAKARIHSQMSNGQRIQQANVVFCSLWDYTVTQGQVNRAWKELLLRL